MLSITFMFIFTKYLFSRPLVRLFLLTVMSSLQSEITRCTYDLDAGADNRYSLFVLKVLLNPNKRNKLTLA